MDVMKDIMKNRSQNTINKNDIWTFLQRNMSNCDFEQALQALQNDGVIYTTVDDKTFAITDEWWDHQYERKPRYAPYKQLMIRLLDR